MPGLKVVVSILTQKLDKTTWSIKMSDQLTAEEIAYQYSVAMDSVNFINAGKPATMHDEWAHVVQKHKDFLETMIVKTYWTTQDLRPIVDCINN